MYVQIIFSIPLVIYGQRVKQSCPQVRKQSTNSKEMKGLRQTHA